MTWTREERLPLTVPVLALDRHVLLPGVSAPLRVTDLGARALVEDLLARPAGERWVGVPARPVEAADESAATDLATLGLVTVATPLAGGDYIIVVEGRSACRLEPLPGDPAAGAYRVARLRHLVDRPEPAGGAARAETTALIQALFSLYDAVLLGASELPATDHRGDDPGVVYRVAAATLEAPHLRAALLAERCPARRRAFVLQVIADQLAFAQRERLLSRPAPLA